MWCVCGGEGDHGGQGPGLPAPADSGAKGQVVCSEPLDLALGVTLGVRSLVQTVSPASVFINPGRQPCPRSSPLSQASATLAPWTVIFLNL